MPGLTISDLSQLRPFGVDWFRSTLKEEPEAFDLYFDLIWKLLGHPLLRLEAWGWLIEARRQTRLVRL